MSYPADWYPDPAGDPTLVRYWDGAQWTEHTQPMYPPAPPVQPATSQQPAPPEVTAPSEDTSMTGGAIDSTIADVAADEDVASPDTEAGEAPGPPGSQPAPPVAEPSAHQPAPPVAQPAPPVAQPAPPVSQPAPPVAQPTTGGGGGGIAGIRSDLLSGDYAESDADARVVLQHSKMLKVRLGESVLARQGSMVAFQGRVDFEHEGAGGIGKFLKKAATGEGVPLMRCSGQGEVFLANDADQVHILHLDDSALSVNGKNILAFESSLALDIQRVQGAGMLTGGLFNTHLSGTGWVAITTKGQPVVLHTDQPTFGDPDAVVAWSANLQTSLNKTVKAKALVGLGSGEAFQVAFQGQGIVIVQPAEAGVPAHSHA